MSINWPRGIQRAYVACWASWIVLTFCYWMFTLVMMSEQTAAMDAILPGVSFSATRPMLFLWSFSALIMPAIGYGLVRLGTRVALPWIIAGFTER